jgi:hypothetical protein
VCAANGIEAENAHDALADVYMTLRLAQLIQSRNPRLWLHGATVMSDKRRVLGMLNQREPLIHVSGIYGRKRHYATIVVPLVQHPTNKNAVICYDAGRDPEGMLNLPGEQLREYLFTRREALEEMAPEIPLVSVSANKCPMLVEAGRMLTQDLARRLDIDPKQSQDWANRVLEAPGFRSRAQNAFRAEFPPSYHAVDGIYDGFLSRDDRRRLNYLLQRSGDTLPNTIRLLHADVFAQAAAADDSAKVFELVLHAKYTSLMGAYREPDALNERIERMRESGAFSPSEFRAYVDYLDERLNDGTKHDALTFLDFERELASARMSRELSADEESTLDALCEDVRKHSEGLAFLKRLAEELRQEAYVEARSRPEIAEIKRAVDARRGVTADPPRQSLSAAAPGTR